jgi:hypothetical protein
MSPSRKFLGKWLSLVLVCLVAGCAAPLKQAIYLDAGFQSQVIDQIVLLPAIDARIDRKIGVNIEKYIRSAGRKILKKKRYQVTLSDNIGEVIQIMEDDLKSGDSTWIKRLGPPDAHYVMVFMLVDVRTKLTFGSTGNAEVAGFLYNKDNGTIAWRDKGIGQVGQGGLMGMAMIGTMAVNAIDIAMTDLLSSMPKRLIIKDTKRINAPTESAETEGERRTVSPEKSSQELTQQKEASRAYGIISITSDPPGAKVFIDGEYKGQTPAEISLTIGTYQLFLQRQLYEPYKDSVMIEKGQTKTLNIRLSPEGKEQK